MTIYSSYSVHTNPQSATIHWLTSMLSRIWRYTNFDDAHYLQFKEFWHQLLETHLTGVRVSTRGGLIPWCHKIRLKPKVLGFPISIISQKHLVSNYHSIPRSLFSSKNLQSRGMPALNLLLLKRIERANCGFHALIATLGRMREGANIASDRETKTRWQALTEAVTTIANVVQ